MTRRRAARALSAWAFAAIFAWIAVVTSRRAAALASGSTPLDAAGETRWMQWAYRDPALIGSFAEAGRKLKPGEAVLIVCGQGCDPNWTLTMAGYGLPRQAVVGSTTEGALGRVFPTRVARGGGDLRILRRSGAPPLDGPR